MSRLAEVRKRHGDDHPLMRWAIDEAKGVALMHPEVMDVDRLMANHVDAMLRAYNHGQREALGATRRESTT